MFVMFKRVNCSRNFGVIWYELISPRNLTIFLIHTRHLYAYITIYAILVLNKSSNTETDGIRSSDPEYL